MTETTDFIDAITTDQPIVPRVPIVEPGDVTVVAPPPLPPPVTLPTVRVKVKLVEGEVDIDCGTHSTPTITQVLTYLSVAHQKLAKPLVNNYYSNNQIRYAAKKLQGQVPFSAWADAIGQYLIVEEQDK